MFFDTELLSVLISPVLFYVVGAGVVIIASHTRLLRSK